MAGAKYVTMTPDDAAAMLATNFERNRNIVSAYVEQLAMIMGEGRFDSMNGQTIVVGTDGVLYDGQHRLSAQVMSGKTLTWLVATVEDGDEKYRTMDRGRSRRTADFIYDPNAKDVAALAKIMVCIEWGSTPLLSALQGKMARNAAADNGIILDYYEANVDAVQNAVRLAKRMRKEAGMGATSAYGTFIMCVERFLDPSMLDAFIDDFCRTPTQSATVASARQNIALNRQRRGNGGIKWTLGILLDAYKHYLAGDGSKMLNKGGVELGRLDAAISARKAGDAA